MQKCGLLFLDNFLNEALLLECQRLSLQSDSRQLLLFRLGRRRLVMIEGRGGIGIAATLLLQIGHIQHVHVHQTVILLQIAADMILNELVLDLLLQLLKTMLYLLLQLSACILNMICAEI